MQNLDIVNLGSKKLGLTLDRIRRLEILDLDIKKNSRDFKISSRIAKISRLTSIIFTKKVHHRLSSPIKTVPIIRLDWKFASILRLIRAFKIAIKLENRRGTFLPLFKPKVVLWTSTRLKSTTLKTLLREFFIPYYRLIYFVFYFYICQSKLNPILRF
jgi:hypothetical protein